MLKKIKNLNIANLQESLSDVRTLGLIAFAVIALLVTWSGIKVVQTNYDLQKQISAMQQENEVNRLANSNLELKNKYLETDQYLELVARRQFNRALPGEKMLVVPKSVAMAHSVEILEDKSVDDQPTSVDEEGPWYERNFNAWLEFLFRKQG